MKFSSISAVILDMDGVLWRGDDPLPGLGLLFTWLHEREIPFLLATNNASKTQADYVAKLARMGVHGVLEERIITSATATAAYMRNHYPAGTRVYVFGMHGLRLALEESGFDIETGMNPVEVVVAGANFELTYEQLKHATLHIRNGADFIGTNPDLTFPSSEGLVPGAGSMLAALSAASGVQPTVIGKPHAPMFETALVLLGTAPERTLMIGDRLDTDILGGRNAGMPTALLFTGVTRPEDLATSEIWSDVAYEDLSALVRAWAGDDWWREQVRAARNNS